jgi:predicted ATPase
MKIIIKAKHKSISPPCEFELPEFSVLTGKNGSGKTHLLEAIADRKLSEVLINGHAVENVRYIGFNGLNPRIEETCDPQTIVSHIKETWSNYDNALKNIVRENNITINRMFDYIGNDQNTINYIKKTLDNSNKNIDQLSEDDFADNFDISFLGQNDFFTAQFALIFKNYHRRQLENNINEYYISKGDKSIKPALSKEDFEEKYGIPPWDFVNKILLETNIPYEVNSPAGTRFESNFNFKLKDRTKGFEISSMDLSTGEKVLMSLALAIYNTGGNVGKPDLLVLDEPDAGLHPSMSKMMVEVLNKNIVNDNNIPTIISTHSPTTVIATEGISIYQLVRGDNKPKKVSIQEAIDLLSSDIPFLRISNDKRRQVFVESKYDVNYYELLTNIYSRIGSLSSEPIYLPARTSNGSNCVDVINVVNDLYNNGNDQIWGIIDWDRINIDAGKIIVLGKNERYAIENYLLDPLLMGILFVRESKKSFTDFGLSEIVSYSDAQKLTKESAQVIINSVLLELGLNSDNVVKYELQNGWQLDISEEFNLHHGHNLEALYKSKYQFLNCYQKEDSLKKDIIKKVINDYPLFTPLEIFKTIKRIS